MLINQFDSKLSATAVSSVANAALLFLNEVRVPATLSLTAPGETLRLPTPKPAATEGRKGRKYIPLVAFDSAIAPQ